MAVHVKNSKDLLGPFLFIVNPNSGTGAIHQFTTAIKKYDQDSEIHVVESTSGEHSQELARGAFNNGYHTVMAVGGDGSVHEVAINIIGNKTALGIIPIGSGNGVARHLGISMDVTEALTQMRQSKVRVIDTFVLNNKPGIGFCGVGIDAQVARDFAETKERGFSNYVKLTIDAFINYRPTRFSLKIPNGEAREVEAYSIVVANTSQFGNNAYINPKGKDDDGLLDIIILKAMPKAAFLTVASRLFLKTITASKWVEHLQAERIEIINHGEALHQIDGEPFGPEKSLNFEVVPGSLNVLTP